MSAEQKIWFIYLTDHHEGPFTPQEVAEKIGQGAVTPQSLGWKDGMAEWVPIESIPELNAALQAPADIPALAPAPAAGGEDGFSLAQMLASQQAGGAPAESAAASIPGASPFSSPAPAADSTSVDPSEAIWTLRVGDQVSGLFSLQQLLGMASQGDIPAGAMLWHSGWADFQPLSVVPEVDGARQSKKTSAGLGGVSRPQGTNTGIIGGAGSGTNPAMGRPRGLAPITAAADIGSDDPTDPRMEGPKKPGLLDKLKGMFAKKPKAAVAVAKTNTAVKRKSTGGLMGSVKRLAPIVGGLLVLAAGGAAYVMFFSSPIPSDLDVLPEDLETMKEVVKASREEGGRIYLSLARGTEDNPADDTAPKFYVASNLPEGTAVSIAISGQPGTLVNKPSFDKTYTAAVGADKLATFPALNDEGKPLPMGEYEMKVTASGVEPLIVNRFLGGKKGAVYTNRLNKYKANLQGEYDKEMQSLREYIDTLKAAQTEVNRQFASYNAGWANPANRTRIVNEWRTYSATGQNLLQQIEQKVKAYLASGGQVYHPRAFQDILARVGEFNQLFQIHGDRLAGKPITASASDLEGLVSAGVGSLEQWLAQAIVKNPFEVLNSKGAAPAAGAPAAAPVPTPAPAAP